MKLKFSALFFIIFISFTSAQQKGYLFAIGGGERPDLVLQRITDLAGGCSSKIIIIPNASSEPVQSAQEIIKDFHDLGCTDINYFFIDTVNGITDSSLKIIEQTKLIFFTGGDQNRLTAVLLNTKLLSRIKDIYNEGAVIGGTSAGAAALSRLMITGDEILNDDSLNAFSMIKAGNIKTAEGLGFIDEVIIDQHFVRRKRHNRLISVVLENPELLGIGIDESTACIFNPDGTIQVLGNNLVILYDASRAENITSDRNSNLAGSNIIMSILKSGDIYDLKTREAK